MRGLRYFHNGLHNFMFCNGFYMDDYSAAFTGELASILGNTVDNAVNKAVKGIVVSLGESYMQFLLQIIQLYFPFDKPGSGRKLLRFLHKYLPRAPQEDHEE